MNELWSRILKFNDEHFPNWRSTPPIYYSNALAGEVGEICNAIKHSVGGGTNLTLVPKITYLGKAAGECVDVFIYMVLFLEALGINSDGFTALFQVKMKERERRVGDSKRSIAVKGPP